MKSRADGDVEAGLLPLVFDIDAPGALVVEKGLTQDQFEVVLRHVLARARYFVVAVVGDVERGAVAVTGLLHGVDVAAALQQTDVLLCAQDAGDIETVVRQTVARKDIGKLLADSLQLFRRRGDKIGNGVGEGVDDIVVVGTKTHQLPFHMLCLGAVFGRTGHAECLCGGKLLAVVVVELVFVTERPPGVGNERIFRPALFPLAA